MESSRLSTEDNAEQRAFWNGAMAEGWVAVEAYIDRIMLPMTEVALARLAPKAGERIMDVGCGCGGTSRAIAASGATVWGVDISDKMIKQARANAGAIDNLSFSVVDAAHAEYASDHEAIFSRYGVMFFADPVAAFRNLRSALVSGGRLVYLCWQSPSLNPWIATGIEALTPYMDGPPPDPNAPGGFSMADPERTAGILRDAGFSSVAVEPLVVPLALGDGVDEILLFHETVGPLSTVVPQLDQAQATAARMAVRSAYEAQLGDEGLKLDAATWLVTAENDV